MPSGVFKPYAGVSTAILIFTKTGHGGTDNVWFYDMKADGFSLASKVSLAGLAVFVVYTGYFVWKKKKRC